MSFFKKVVGALATAIILVMGTMQVFAVTLTAEQARNIALSYVPEGSIYFNTKQDYNKFEIKLYNQKDQTFYEIDINKTTQKMTSFESESQNNFGSIKVALTEQNVKDIVLKEIPQAQFITTYLDRDDGLQKYKISFYTSNTTGVYKINPENGMILEREIKFIENPIINQIPQNTVQNIVQIPSIQTPSASIGSDMISMEQAKQIALSKAPNAIIWEIKIDTEDGRLIYEGEMKEGYIEYEFEIDAATGVILEWDIDIDD
ncbi:PepSY domain-containing protein [Lachnospiraceae bacterium 46-61]